MFVCPQKLYVEAPTPNAIFGDGALKRNLGLDEAMTVGPHDGTTVHIRRDTRELFSVSLFLSHMHPIKKSHEHTAKWRYI